MASSVTQITTSKVLADCTAVTLAGATKILAEGMVAGDSVTIYEETVTEGNYQKVPADKQRTVALTPTMPSILFEGYGNYKFLLGADTATGLKVGYVSA